MRNKEEIKKFKEWLESQGAETLDPTNEYEALRFKGKAVGVLYTSGSTVNKYTSDAIAAFRNNKKWDGAPVSTGREKSYIKQKRILLERDGSKCFYCDLELGDDITVEHLIPLASGGKNDLSNMVLAHKKCNQNAGCMSIYMKVRTAIKAIIENNN